MSSREEIVEGMARGLWTTAYAEWVEGLSRADRKEAGLPVSLQGVDWTDDSPPTPESADQVGRELAALYESENEASLDELAAMASEADGEDIDDEEFGRHLAYMAMGMGIGWFDDHARFELKMPAIEVSYDGEYFEWSGQCRTTRKNPCGNSSPTVNPWEVRSSSGLEGVFADKDNADFYAEEIRSAGAPNVQVTHRSKQQPIHMPRPAGAPPMYHKPQGRPPGVPNPGRKVLRERWTDGTEIVVEQNRWPRADGRPGYAGWLESSRGLKLGELPRRLPISFGREQPETLRDAMELAKKFLRGAHGKSNPGSERRSGQWFRLTWPEGSSNNWYPSWDTEEQLKILRSKGFEDVSVVREGDGYRVTWRWPSGAASYPADEVQRQIGYLRSKGIGATVTEENPAGLTSKGERMYEHIKAGYAGDPRAKEIASRTVLARAHEVPGLKRRNPYLAPSRYSPSQFDRAALRAGTDVEMEHTTDPKVAQQIAMDHLAEDPEYYRKLATIHRSRR